LQVQGEGSVVVRDIRINRHGEHHCDDRRDGIERREIAISAGIDEDQHRHERYRDEGLRVSRVADPVSQGAGGNRAGWGTGKDTKQADAP
jgi:hypothetical protein